MRAPSVATSAEKFLTCALTLLPEDTAAAVRLGASARIVLRVRDAATEEHRFQVNPSQPEVKVPGRVVINVAEVYIVAGGHRAHVVTASTAGEVDATHAMAGALGMRIDIEWPGR